MLLLLRDYATFDHAKWYSRFWSAIMLPIC